MAQRITSDTAKLEFANVTIASLNDRIASLEADNARLRKALQAMVTATSNFNVGLAEARELADAALAAYKQAQGG
jgi:uncharacterized coiled-coil protein SlyX